MLPILSNTRENGGYESLNDGPFRFFKPFCLPILGTYDHYGRIDKIRKDRNTELLEKYFEMPISEFIECISGRHDRYGDYSTIQKVYGKGNIALTPESLATIHFKTGDDKVVTHPYITHLNEWLGKKYKEEGKPFIPIKIYWATDDELVLEQMDYKGELHKQSFKSSHKGGEYYAGKDFLERIHSTYKIWNERIHPAWGGNEFIFGVPTVKQARADTLLKLTRSFIRPEAYKKVAKTFKAISDRYNKRYPDSLKWEKQRNDEYVEAVKAWKHAVAVQEKYKGLTDDKLTPEQVAERRATHFLSFGGRDTLFRGGPITDGFKSTYSGEEFLGIYGDVMLDDEFIKRFEEFKFVERGMVAANVMLYDNHSLEQHGDIGEQMTYLKICMSVAEKVRKERDYDR
jgi:hypothetical protein